MWATLNWRTTVLFFLACSVTCLPTPEPLPVESDAISSKAADLSVNAITNPHVMVNGALYTFYTSTWVVMADQFWTDRVTSSNWVVPTSSVDTSYLANQIAAGIAAIYRGSPVTNALKRIAIGGGWELEVQNFAYNSWPAAEIPYDVIKGMAVSAMGAATHAAANNNRFGWNMWTSNHAKDIISFKIYPQNGPY